MIHFAYNDLGEFDGFYDTEIHQDIPKNSLKINKDLWQELAKSLYKVKLEVLDNIKDKMLTLEDLTSVFIKFNRNRKVEKNVVDKDKLMLVQQLANNKIELIKQKQINRKIVEESVKMKIDSINNKKLNKNIMKEIADTKLNIMKLKNNGGNK
ncbi:hypothetical protein N2W52_001899 [Clostridium perfringens]|nr:hypothetical protein [Clostridium perfringens]MDK0982911.1 hypothetical protein [Clostridium perfringens]